MAPNPPPVFQPTPAPPAPQATTLAPSAGIVAVIPPAATETDSGVVLDADMEREQALRESLMHGMGGLSLVDYHQPYFPVQLSDNFLYTGGEGRLRERTERNLNDEEAGVPKLEKTTIRELRDREREKERERDWERRESDKSRDRGDMRRRRSVSRPGRRRAESVGPVEGKRPRWTRISREIVSIRAVEEIGYRFEPHADSVTIHKVLTREDIDELVELTSAIRGRKERERGGADRRDERRDERHRDRDRDRRDDRDRLEREREGARERRDRDRGRGEREHGHRYTHSHPPHLEMPLHPPMGMAPAPAPAPPQGPPPPPQAPAPPQFHAAPLTAGVPRGNGLVENPAEPGTFLAYRRAPPKPAGF